MLSTIFCDASLHGDSAGIALVAEDENGACMDAVMKNVQAKDIMEAELKGILFAVKYAKNLKADHPILIQTDNKGCAAIINGEKRVPYSYSRIVEEINDRPSDVFIRWESRRENQCADALASLAYRRKNLKNVDVESILSIDL